MMYEQPTIVAFAGLVILLSLGDYFMTLEALRYPFTSEANPVVNWTIQKWGVPIGVGWVKLLQIVMTIGYVQYYPQTSGAWILAIFCPAFAYLAVRNYNVAEKRKGQGFTRGTLKEAQDRAIAKAAAKEAARQADTPAIDAIPAAASRKTAASFESPRPVEVTELSVW